MKYGSKEKLFFTFFHYSGQLNFNLDQTKHTMLTISSIRQEIFFAGSLNENCLLTRNILFQLKVQKIIDAHNLID